MRMELARAGKAARDRPVSDTWLPEDEYGSSW
jgi:hypothetical protein